MKIDMKLAEITMRFEAIMHQLYYTASYDQWKLENELRELCHLLNMKVPKESINIQGKRQPYGINSTVWKVQRDFCRPETL